MPMSTTWASKISWILSPTSSYIDCMSRLADRPSWTLLTTASSAARSSVSARRRFVSSNRRAFSRATLRLEASVVSRRTSESENAFVRSTFWSEIRPLISPPQMSGANRTDLVSSPWMAGFLTPRSRSQASTSLTRRTWWVSMTILPKPPTGRVALGKRTPFSIVYW